MPSCNNNLSYYYFRPSKWVFYFFAHRGFTRFEGSSRGSWSKTARDAALASSESASSLSPHPKEKEPKRKYLSKIEAKEKPLVTEEILEGPATVVLDEYEIKDNTETVSLQRKRRKKLIAQPEDVDGLF